MACGISPTSSSPSSCKGQVDAEYDRRARAFLQRSVAAGKPFFLYHNHSLMHFPMVPRQEFRGQSTNGDWGDCLLMLDNDFGRILDYLTELGVADNTIVVFAGDNGPEDHLLGRGTGRLLRRLVLQLSRGRHPYPVPHPLARQGPGPPEQRDGARQ